MAATIQSIGIKISGDDQIVCGGCFCCKGTLYTKMPDCIGCSGGGECLCCAEDFCVKAKTDPFPIKFNQDDTFLCQIQCYCCQVGFKKKDIILLKAQAQVCCIVSDAAIPPTDPKVCACCGLALYPKQGCFKKLSEMTGGAPPSSENMVR
mmetsp:Transcript_68159/g.154200  ORF Transcript_68159/g.154200 Transcript_68159/m.154200 type:complete len:150 (-) Transcript_68159:254-703(-)